VAPQAVEQSSTSAERNTAAPPSEREWGNSEGDCCDSLPIHTHCFHSQQTAVYDLELDWRRRGSFERRTPGSARPQSFRQRNAVSATNVNPLRIPGGNDRAGRIWMPAYPTFAARLSLATVIAPDW